MLRPLTLLLLAVAPLLAAEPIVMRDVLVLAPIYGGGRVAHTDRSPSFEQFAWPAATPAAVAGAQVEIWPGRKASWVAMQANEQGKLAHKALRSAMVAWPIDLPEAGSYVLEGRFASVKAGGLMSAGDVYGMGIVRVPLALPAGKQQLFLHAIRGSLSAKLVPAKAAAELIVRDGTLPDLRRGEPLDSQGALPVINTTAAQLDGVVIEVGDDEVIRKASHKLSSLAPLSVLKEGFPLRTVEGWSAPEDAKHVEVPIRLRVGGEVVHEALIRLGLRKPQAVARVTFTSAIDGSCQYAGVRWPSGFQPGRKYALILTLHGAGVEGAGQAAAISPKDWAFVAGATNRRKFGFDWEDWGRIDAIEVLEMMLKRYPIDPSRVYLSGHSMGGHGTWQVGVQHADRFAAIFPSAGWVSFWTYGGALTDATPQGKLYRRAMATSDTLAQLRNLADTAIYVVHGEADRNVPPDQARKYLEALEPWHKDHRSHFEPKVGHWWDRDKGTPGADCVDWAPAWRMFRRRVVDLAPRRVDYRTPNPGVNARHSWVELRNQAKQHEMSRLLASSNGHGRFRFTTTNLTRFRFDPRKTTAAEKLTIEIDGKALGERPLEGELEAARTTDGWTLSKPQPPQGRKEPARYGPFKQAYTNRFVMVYPTKGTPEENAAALAKARYDASTWWYRGNGRALLIPDTALDEAKHAGRHWILYGNETSNAVWARHAGSFAIRVARGEIRLGQKTWQGADLACMAVQPHPTEARTLIGLVGGSGPAGVRLTMGTRTFVSGVHYPDVAVWNPALLRQGFKAIKACGFFGDDWNLAGADLVYGD